MLDFKQLKKLNSLIMKNFKIILLAIIINTKTEQRKEKTIMENYPKLKYKKNKKEKKKKRRQEKIK